MRRIGLSLFCLPILALVSCTETLEEYDSDAQGKVQISLSAEGRTSAVTKATTESLPSVDDFTIEIFKISGDSKVRLYRDSYPNATAADIPLNVGSYELLARYSGSLGVGFDAAYFAATQSFEVEQQKITTVSATAKLANVKVAVVYGDNLVTDYSVFYAVVRARDNDDYELTFASDETRAGYLPSGSLIFELYAEVNDTLMYYPYEAGEYSPNDFVTFNVDTNPAEGDLNITTTIDKETILVEKNVSVSYTTLPKDDPKISFAGLDANLDVEVVEGVDTGDEEVRANIVAYGEIANCYINISSAYLTSLGLPDQVDLLNMDESVADLISQAGITWYAQMEGASLAYVDFSGLLAYIATQPYDSSNPTTSISLTIVDSLGQSTTSDTFTVTNVVPQFTLGTPAAADVWGWKIVGQTVTYDATKCNPDMIVLQYYDSSDWVTVNGTDDGNGTITYDTISGLTAGADYEFRGVYNGGYTLESSVTTESPTQVGNASLDEWQTVTHTVSGSTTRDWWQPWSEGETDVWWAVNSMVSMQLSSTSSMNYRVFPCAGYSTEYSTNAGSGYSAHLVTINVGSINTSLWAWGTDYIGELFIGTANDDGSHYSDGHSFSTRPSKITFDYKFASQSSETCGFDFWLKDADGNAIAEYSTTTLSDTNGSWVTCEVDVDYKITDAKPATIYMSFVASTASDPSVSTSVTREFAGTNYSIHSGSAVRIDNIKLIYTDPSAN